MAKPRIVEQKSRRSYDFCEKLHHQDFALTARKVSGCVRVTAFVPELDSLDAAIVGAYLVEHIRDKESFNKYYNGLRSKYTKGWDTEGERDSPSKPIAMADDKHTEEVEGRKPDSSDDGESQP